MGGSIHDRVAELVPQVRQQAARTEAERRLPTEVLAALLDSGLFRLQPEDGPDRAARVLDAVDLLAAACGSTGWVSAHAGAVPWLLDLFEPAALDRVSAPESADPLVAFSLEPGGRLVGADDELRLTGRWPGVTGAAHAGWLALACRRPTGPEPGRIELVLVPADACRLEDVPDVVGLTASGAQDVIVDRAPVAPGDLAPPVADRTASLAPIGAVVAMALVGAARGAVEAHVEQVRSRVAVSHAGEEVTRDLAPASIARASSQVDAASLILTAPHEDPDARPRDPFEDQLYAVDQAVEAAAHAFASARAHALDADDPVARLWRDVRVGAHHARGLVERLRTIGD